MTRATYVSEATLTGLVKELRRALDASGEPSRIRTAHGVGYALEVAADAPRPASSDQRHWLMVSERPIVLAAGENLIGACA